MSNTYRDQWARLLSAKRVSLKKDAEGRPIPESFELHLYPPEEFRSPFETDYCRVIFSSAFRRLAGKTQVHPFSEIDYVHNRLTHSLEVSSVVYSLARRVCRHLVDVRGDLDERRVDDLCWIVRAAGLAHDIGNPPFGHAGEDAIRTWARNLGDGDRRLLGSAIVDFERFDGNAQGFRMLSRPDLRAGSYYRLTTATLGAMVKYPFRADDEAARAKNKFAAFTTESGIFDLVAEDLGLVRGDGTCMRHPLSYLTEAADDICYCITDFEDAVLKGILKEEDVRRLFLDGMTDEDRKVEAQMPFQRVRARTIGFLVETFADCFVKNYEAIMAGELKGDLKSHVESRWSGVLERIGKWYDVVFSERKKLLIEIGAHRNFAAVLDGFKDMLRGRETSKGSTIGDRLVSLAFGSSFYKDHRNQSSEWWAHSILDYVVGMTDEYMRTISASL